MVKGTVCKTVGISVGGSSPSLLKCNISILLWYEARAEKKGSLLLFKKKEGRKALPNFICSCHKQTVFVED